MTAPAAQLPEAPADESPEVEHLVSRWRSLVAEFVSRVYLVAPRSLCGVVLWADPDRPCPPPYPLTPFCPACVAIDGRDIATIEATTEHVPDRW